MKITIKGRVLASICSLSAITLVISMLLLSLVFSNVSDNHTRESIWQQANLIAIPLNQTALQPDVLASLPRYQNMRLTLVRADGKVIYDNVAQPSAMGNHLDRPEIALALEQGYAKSERASDTIGGRTFYCAIRLNNGNVVRVASTTQSVYTSMSEAAGPIVLLGLVVFIFSVMLAEQVTRRIVKPINSINLEALGSENVYEELIPLLGRIAQQNQEIAHHISELEDRQEAFTAITSGMSEGLVLLDSRGKIVTANQSALNMLGAPDIKYEGRSYLELSRLPLVKASVESALAMDSVTRDIPLDGAMLELYASPVLSDKRSQGVLLLLVDVTQRHMAEQLRREFSANVSHELKTPLTSVVGSAELLKNGLVKNEDIPDFYNRIYSESNRLIALVDDIIKLSRLDEHQVQEDKTTVSLKEIAQEVKAQLDPEAESRNVTLLVSGDDIPLNGVRSMISELIFNLAQNAIKYNRPFGEVKITLSKENGRGVIVVSDTGIGISKEHHSRVFERFYRVDKSHSKQTGGTGLGLSIVKHIADYHGGSVSLQSKLDVGTAITVRLPC